MKEKERKEGRKVRNATTQERGRKSGRKERKSEERMQSVAD